MDEYIDILNEVGEPNGTICLKSEAHKKGLFHASAHIWIFNNNKEVLIQKRASNKDTFPNLWDVSVAGHISAGEKPIISAIREVQEEIGLSIKQHNLHYIGTSKKRIQHNTNFIDSELHHIYMCKIDFDIKSLKIQTEEVSEIKSIELQSFIKTVNSNKDNFVPHGNNYYKFIFNAIKKYTLFK
jgi:isopentenyl-diphosphate delta-isomerase